MNCAYLILGGNLGDRAAMIKEAEALFSLKGIEITKQSSLYETAPWGMENSTDFLNKVIEVRTKMNAAELLQACLDAEKKLGRERVSGNYVSRTIDVDILLFNNEIVNEKHLHVPHPRMHLRKFVLVPLAEIAGSYLHPILKKTISELLIECPDQGDVLPYKK